MQANLPPIFPLVISALIFVIGAIGVIVRRNAIVVFMCVEMMLSAVNLSLITAAHYLHSLEGVLVVFFVMILMIRTSSEAAVGLAIFVLLFRSWRTIKVDEINLLKW